MKNSAVFYFFLIVRIGSVFLVQTHFVPDEYWQALEVAHNKVFGYGYLTWEWKLGIRSYFYPLIFAVIYKILELLQLDYPFMIIYCPRILQSILSAYSDLCFYRWSGARKWSIFVIASSWFWFYTASRTLINTFETALTTITLSKFPWLGKSNDEDCTFIWFLALICSVRPTAVVNWVPLVMFHLTFTKMPYFELIFSEYLPKCLAIFGLSILLDSIAHGSFIVTSYEFLKLNILKNIGEWYGSQPWYWYLSSGFPAILGIQFIPFIISTLVVLRNRRSHINELALLGSVVFAVFIYSLIPHKEFRFLLPILPIVFFIIAKFLFAWSLKAKRFKIWIVGVILLFGNVGPAWYFSFYHQRGVLDVMEPLRQISFENPQNTSLLFLMPCHSTPFYSHLHINVTARFLTCEPNFDNTPNYIDEADDFYLSPSVWLRKNYPPNGTLPSHIICFDTLVASLSDVLSRYKPVYKIFNTNIASSRTGYHVIINERIDF